MALSPGDARATTGSAAPGATAAKAKALTILNKVKASTPTTGNATPNDDPLPDLSEQLNEETKRKYVKGRKLGEGQYAVVYRGHLASDPSSFVAIKKIKVVAENKDGLSMDAIREVKYLQELSHPNIIALYSVFSSKAQNLNLVLEYLPLGDLEGLIRDTNGVNYGAADIKAWMGMLARAVHFCHENFVLHRDIKPNNLLIAEDGELKLADFGLARSFADPYSPMTHNVITRWYRPPELFFKARHYSGAVDIWSMGAVFAEMIMRLPLMPGDTDLDQVAKICAVVGTPTEENWPGVSKLDAYVSVLPENPKSKWTQKEWDNYLGPIGTSGLELLKSMLVLDPRKRATAKEALMHEWWRSEPRPTKKENLPKRGGGEARMGEQLKRRGGEVEESNGRADKVARRLFSDTKKG